MERQTQPPRACLLVGVANNHLLVKCGLQDGLCNVGVASKRISPRRQDQVTCCTFADVTFTHVYCKASACKAFQGGPGENHTQLCSSTSPHQHVLNPSLLVHDMTSS